MNRPRPVSIVPRPAAPATLRELDAETKITQWLGILPGEVERIDARLAGSDRAVQTWIRTGRTDAGTFAADIADALAPLLRSARDVVVLEGTDAQGRPFHAKCVLADGLAIDFYGPAVSDANVLAAGMKQQMVHNEKLLDMLTKQQATLLEYAASMSKQMLDLSASVFEIRVRTTEREEELISKKHERELELARARSEQSRKDELFGGLVKYGSILVGQFVQAHLASMVAGATPAAPGAPPAPEQSALVDAATRLRAFVGTLSPDQLDAFLAKLTPDQVAFVMPLLVKVAPPGEATPPSPATATPTPTPATPPETPS